MRNGKRRICDVCRQEIGPGEEARTVRCPPETLALLSEGMPAYEAPPWDPHPEGGFRLDVCEACEREMSI